MDKKELRAKHTIAVQLSPDAMYVTLVALEMYKEDCAENKVSQKWVDAATEAFTAIRSYVEHFYLCCGSCKNFREGKDRPFRFSYCNTKRITVESYKNDCKDYECTEIVEEK